LSTDDEQQQREETDTSKVQQRALVRMIEKAIQGDETAFNDLYRHYLKEVIYYAQMLLIDKASAEDVAQEAILSVHRNLGMLESPYAFRAYLMRTVHNACVSHNRRAHVQHESASVGEEIEQTLVDGEISPEASTERKLLNVAIRRVIDSLPTTQRMTVYLHYYDELSYTEIAEILETTTTTVGSNLNKARKKLKQMIERDNIVSEELPKEDDTLCGRAMAPVVGLALGEGIDIAITAEQFQRVALSTDKLLATQAVQTAGTTSAHAAGSTAVGQGFINVILGILGVLLAGALAIAGFFFVSYQQQADAEAAIPAVERFEPTAEIVFISAVDPDTGAANLSEAMIDLSQGKALSWTLTDEAGATIHSGTGDYASGIFDDLQPGSYLLEWITENVDGGQARISREFTVE
jgi:RNA polymerase sigma-70 factor (ECF subfamily)